MNCSLTTKYSCHETSTAALLEYHDSHNRLTPLDYAQRFFVDKKYKLFDHITHFLYYFWSSRTAQAS